MECLDVPYYAMSSSFSFFSVFCLVCLHYAPPPLAWAALPHTATRTTLHAPYVLRQTWLHGRRLPHVYATPAP